MLHLLKFGDSREVVRAPWPRFCPWLDTSISNADMFFQISGVYQYDATGTREAQDWCRQMTRLAFTRDEKGVSHDGLSCKAPERRTEIDSLQVQILGHVALKHVKQRRLAELKKPVKEKCVPDFLRKVQFVAADNE